jgi:flagellar biosynthesis protein FlhF
VEQLRSRHDFADTDVLLVLSLPSKYRDLLQIHDHFGKMPLSGSVFSKADETSELWSMFGLATESKLPIYCVTTGQEVPEDITFATADELSRMTVERWMR